jgi:hypothetical protein
MTQQRTVAAKVADANQAFEAFRDALTPPDMRRIHDEMTGAAKQQAAAEEGNVQAYVDLLQASLSLRRVVSANDRAALIAAVMLTQSGVSRPQLDVIDGGE